MNINKLVPSQNIKYIHIVGGKYNWLVEGGAVGQPRPQGFSLAPPIFVGRNPGDEVGCRIHFRAMTVMSEISLFQNFLRAKKLLALDFCGQFALDTYYPGHGD